MFYGWEDFKEDYRSLKHLETSVSILPDTLVTFSDLKKVEVMCSDARAKDTIIARLQQALETATEALKSEQSKHAETVARNKELEGVLEERTLRERCLKKQMENQGEKHDRELREMTAWYEKEIQGLVSMLQTSEEAEEMLCAQLGDFEAEAMEQTRDFNAQIASLSQSLARKEEELSSVQSELEAMRQSKLTLKEMESMDLAAQVAKLKHECEKLRETTGLSQGELEKTRTQVECFKRQLAMAKSESPLQMKESPSIVEKVKRSSQLCRAESLSLLVMERMYRLAAVAV